MGECAKRIGRQGKRRERFANERKAANVPNDRKQEVDAPVNVEAVEHQLLRKKKKSTEGRPSKKKKYGRKKARGNVDIKKKGREREDR